MVNRTVRRHGHNDHNRSAVTIPDLLDISVMQQHIQMNASLIVGSKNDGLDIFSARRLLQSVAAYVKTLEGLETSSHTQRGGYDAAHDVKRKDKCLLLRIAIRSKIICRNNRHMALLEAIC